ncbi:MAG: hypothetical protein HBSAPP04_17880 [Ignavibacteriaceae bacterium]|nr:MAG: hypothetical protein EDM75_02960 [Chlorobiota bacterium]GJQ32949.1 MAG: hypothetical protein HBSAPP04_17880 [Ignavibacteriaceae bacterium]
MRKFVTFFAVILFTGTIVAQNVSVSDYKVPVSTAKILRLSGSYNFAQSTDSVTTHVTANNASATALFRYFYSSLPFAYFVDVDATGGKNFADYNHDISIRPSIRKYLADDKDWFGFGALDLRHANTFKQIESNLTVGGGYGRYINATALAKAVRIEDHLLKEGVISARLPKETMIRIANIIEREAEYRGVFGDTYEKNWYEDIEKEMRATGLLQGGTLGAIGILRTQQVLKGINEKVNERYFGWDLTAGVLFNLSTRDRSDTRSPALSVGGRFSNPIGWNSQVNAYFNVNTPFDSTFFKTFIASAGADYFYELGNRINFIAGYKLNFIKSNTKFLLINEDSYMDHNLTAGFIFYLENYINLGIQGGLYRSGLLKTTDITFGVTLQYNVF